jgi:hypothetical protein
VLRLDSVNGHQRQDQFCVRIGAGLPEDDDQIVEHRGKDVLRIARHVSEELNGSTVDRVETLDGPAVGLKPPRSLVTRPSRTVRKRLSGWRAGAVRPRPSLCLRVSQKTTSRQSSE